MTYTRTVALDFDGVLHRNITAWTKGTDINDGPTPGALEAVKGYLKAGLRVVVYSARVKDGIDVEFTSDIDGSGEERREAVRAWLAKHAFPELEVTVEKPNAVLYVDDRAYLFSGDNWPSADFILGFQPWNRIGRAGGSLGRCLARKHYIQQLRRELQKPVKGKRRDEETIIELLDALEDYGL
jgi:hypothetical protein